MIQLYFDIAMNLNRGVEVRVGQFGRDCIDNEDIVPTSLGWRGVDTAHSHTLAHFLSIISLGFSI